MSPSCRVRRLFAGSDGPPNRPASTTHRGPSALLLAALFATVGVQAAEDGEGAVADAARGVVPRITLRPRYAYVDQANKALPAEAYTMRTLVGWQTPSWRGLSADVQVLNVGHAGETHYAVSTARPSPYPVVRDADNTDFNHLNIAYAHGDDLRLRVGRQEVALDNERMIGLKNFSQTMQVFDAAMVSSRIAPGVDLRAGHLWRQRTTSATQLGSRTWLLNLQVAPLPGATLTTYAYLQDQADTNQVTGFSDNSNRIVGVRLNGAQVVDAPWALLYTAEIAKQDPYADGDRRIDATYSHIGAGIRYEGLWARFDQQVLGSPHGSYAFQTPLGSTHTFQGWADLFTTTPSQGLRDRYATIEGSVSSMRIRAEYHAFRGDADGMDFGREVDLRVSRQITRWLTARGEVADYRAGDPRSGKPDTRKIWITLAIDY